MDVEIYAYSTTIDCTKLPEHATVYVKQERPPERDADSLKRYQEVLHENIRR
jgi:hypothetical protein